VFCPSCGIQVPDQLISFVTMTVALLGQPEEVW